MDSEKIVIIGAGPAGLEAGVYAGRAGLNPMIVTGMLPGGLLTQTGEVENFPGFPDGIPGFELMDRLQKQAERFGCRIEYDEIKSVKLTDGGKQTLIFGSGREIACDVLIIATGAAPRYLGLDAEERLRGHGVSACATCDGAFYQDVPVVVIGGGDSAMEEASILSKFASRVYLIHRRDEFRASKIMLERVKNNPKIELVTSAIVEDILGDTEVAGVQLKIIKDNSTRRIDCKGYFAALGHTPATGLFKDFITLDDHGCIRLLNTSETNLKGVFAAGDCADPRYRQAAVAAGMGVKAAMDAEKYLESFK